MNTKIKCFYCGQSPPDADIEKVRHYEPCSECEQRIKDNYILIKITGSPTKKYPDAITRVNDSFYYPTGDFMIVKQNVAEKLPHYKEDQKMMCLLDDAYDLVYKSSKWYTKLWYFLKKLYRKKILHIILIIWLLSCTLLNNIAKDFYGCYAPLIGFYNPVGTILSITKTPKTDTNYIYAAGKVVILYQWNCPDCEKAYPLLKKDFPDATYIAAQSDLGRKIRAGNLSEPIEFAPSILIADFDEFYHVYVPYYNDDTNNDEFVYDALKVEEAKHKRDSIRTEFNKAVDELGIGTKYENIENIKENTNN